MEVVASLSQGRTADAQCGLFTYKSVLVIFEPPCTRPANVLFCSRDRNCITLFNLTCNKIINHWQIKVYLSNFLERHITR